MAEPKPNRTLVVLQPGYLPWLGFFNQLWRSDTFVFYDDVQYDKHGWRNRNRIRTPEGAHWLTVPVRHRGLQKPLIKDVRIEAGHPWARKQIGTIRQHYRTAPFADRYLPELESMLHRRWEWLVDLDLALIEWMAGAFGIRRDTHLASELNVGGGKSERLVNICRHFGATHYLSGASAREYLDPTVFEAAKIEVVWQDFQHPVYPQRYEGFVPYLSALDLLLNVGDESLPLIASSR